MSSSFHEGELAVQRRAGVALAAARLSGMLAPADLRGGFARFLESRTFGALAARDSDGLMWVSPLAGPPGTFEAAGPTTLVVHAAPPPGDPLYRVRAGQSVGLTVIDFATRRRIRMNGVVVGSADNELVVAVEQAYGNCPKYIHPDTHVPPSRPGFESSPGLSGDDIEFIRAAQTFIIGSTHPTRGVDASHRGGPVGFVRVEDESLWWPDYPGNNMFNTLGNLSVDPAVALLFVGLDGYLYVSGTAAIEWVEPGSPGDDGGTGRRIRVGVSDCRRSRRPGD